MQINILGNRDEKETKGEYSVDLTEEQKEAAPRELQAS